jgi:NADH dehydrogenase
VVAPGSLHSYFGKTTWEEYAPGLKSLQDAIRIREKILLAFELAESANDETKLPTLLTFVIIGAGPTGVEMAGALAEIAHQSLKKNFRKIDPTLAKIYLIEGGSQLLSNYPAKLAARPQVDLEKRGVTVLLNTRVTDITADGVYIGEKFIPSYNIIWAAGNTASSLLQSLEVPMDK